VRVAVVAPNYAPVVGGVETVVTQVAGQLADLGCAVEVWTHKIDGLTESDFFLAAKADRAFGA